MLKRKTYLLHAFGLLISALVGSLLAQSSAFAESAFTIYDKTTSLEELEKSEAAQFYELEKKKYELIERIAKTKYLEEFWKKKAAEQKVTAEEAEKNYVEKNVKVSEAEIKATLDRFKDNEQLKQLPVDERKRQVTEYLKDREARTLISSIISAAIASKKLVISYPKPKEPVYTLTITKDDHVRYGPKDTDTKPIKCTGENCEITIVEYSEFECPFCARVLPDVKKVLTEFKGKIRWTVRDFPLSFHARARPAAVAAKCAAKQGKYWEMYHKLFENQRKLSDADLEAHAKEVGVFNDKYKKCVANPKEVAAIIDENIKTGGELGVTGTPAFFINGRKLSGALPYSEFKRVIDEEMLDIEKAKAKKAG